MKNIFLFPAILTACIASAQGQHVAGNFSLTGNLSGQSDGLMYLYYNDKDNKRIKDSATITNGKFSFHGKVNGSTMGYLQLKEPKRNENNSTSFFIDPSDMNVSLTEGDFRAARFTGSKTQNEYAAIESKKQKIEARWKIVMDTLTAVNKRSNVEFQELKDWVLQPYQAEMKDIDFTFFREHPQSPVTAYYLRFYVSELPLDSLQMFYNKLGSKMQQTANGRDLADQIKKIRAGSPGSMAADFTALDINGNKLSLSDFKGKYVLLDFWASWCVPCRKGNPHLKELYTKYHDKGIEFIGVSDDDSKPDAWHKAVEKDELPWHHVLRGFDMHKLMSNEPNENDISNKFGISSLPTKILIDPHGKIIGRYSEESEPLDAELKNIFGS